MRTIKIIIACSLLLTAILFVGCDKMMNKIADTVNKAAKDSTGVLKGLNLPPLDGDSLSTVNGVQLKYQGITVLKEAFQAKELIIDEGAANITLTGIEAGETDLIVTYREYAQGDASFSIVGSGIKGKTKSGKPYLITDITGKIPRTLNLNIKDGAGTISLSAMQDNQQVSLETGAGNIDLDHCIIKKLTTITGAGGIALNKCQIDNMEAHVGAGNIILRGSKITKRNFETGAGKVITLP